MPGTQVMARPIPARERPLAIPAGQFRPRGRTLGTAGRAVYDAVVEGMARGQLKIRLPQGVSVDDVHDIVRHARLDVPELFNVRESSVSYAGGHDHPQRLSLNVSYRFSHGAAHGCLARMESRAAGILDLVRDKDVPERVELLHDWLAGHGRYGRGSAGLDHLASGPILFGHGVCDGYSLALKFLLDRAGVRSWVATGTSPSSGPGDGSGGHAWNIVDFGTAAQPRWAHVDVTFDLAENHGGISHAQFGLSDAEAALGHASDSTPYPACPQSLGWMRAHGQFLPSARELAWEVRRAAHAGQDTLTVQLPLSMGDPEGLSDLVRSTACDALDGTDARGVRISYSQFDPNVFTIRLKYRTFCFA